jgi:ArsR family transcriptional regulator
MEQKELLKRLASLADPTRLEIVSILSEKGELCACELLKRLSISQGTLSHHMKELSGSGIVSCRKDGKWCHYSLNAAALCEVTGYLDSLCCPHPATPSCPCCSK